MKRLWWPLVLAAMQGLCAVALAQEPSEDAARRDAINRLVEAHDVSLPVNIGRVYVKQAALTAARDLLYEKGKAAGLDPKAWNLEHPGWKQAEQELVAGTDDLIERRVTRGFWVQEAWSEEVSTILNGEQADEVAVHFRTEGGQLQRRVIEWFVGELIMETYTFTDRLKYGVPGSEKEMEELRKVTYEARSHFPPIYDLTEYPDAVKFASRGPGVEYFKMMVIQGVHAVHRHLESVADEARATIRSRAALADPYVAAAKR